MIIKIFKKSTIEKEQIAAGGTKHRCPNIDKLKRLGFKKISLRVGLNKIININGKI